MAKKVLAVSVVLGLALAGAAFAAGPWDLSGNSAAGQKIVVSGNVSIDGSYNALLRSGGRDYELIVPPELVSQSGVEEGSRVTVEGYATDGGTAGGIALVVTRATIHGRDYDLSQYQDPRRDARGSTVRGHRNRWDNGQGYGQDNGQGYGRDNGQGYGRDNSRRFGRDGGQGYGGDRGQRYSRHNGRRYGRDGGQRDGRDNGQGNGRDGGRDNGQDNGRNGGRDNGQDNGRGNGRDNGPDGGQDNGSGQGV